MTFFLPLLLDLSNGVRHRNAAAIAAAADLLPLIPPQSGEKVPDDSSRYYLDSLMEFMVTQVCQ